MDDQPKGYSTLSFPENVEGTRQTNSFVHGLLLAGTIFDTGSVFRAPKGLMGARAALLFTIGRLFPDKEEITRSSVTSAILQCDLAIELVGRRIPGSVPLTHQSATADFALHVGTFRGAPITGWSDIFSGEEPIVLSIDGHPLQKIESARFFAHCLNCIGLLADALTKGGDQLNAGDLVSAGWSLPALQTRAGQTVRIDVPGLDPVEVRLE